MRILLTLLLLIPSLVFAVPSTGPNGEDAGGTYSLYFQNLSSTTCSNGSYISGYDSSSSVTYMTPICTPLVTTNDWGMRGNTVTALDFIWTLNRSPLIFRTNATTDSTNKMVITSTGGVGIGTSAPTTALTVSWTVLATRLTDSTNGSWFPWTNNRNYIRGNTYLSWFLLDEQDPSYFIDPAGTSVLNQITVSGSITAPSPSLSGQLATKWYVDNTITTRISASTTNWSLSGNSIALGSYIWTSNNQPLVFRTNATTDSTNKMVITSTGGVGIGTSAPTTALTVSWTVLATRLTDSTNGSWFPWTNNRNYIRGNTYLSWFLLDEQDPSYFIDPAGTSVLNQITVSGSITAPSPSLSGQLATKWYVDNTITTRISASTTNWSLSGNSIALGSYIWTSNNQPLVFRTNATTDSTNKMVITSTGGVGIGTSAPTTALTVSWTVLATRLTDSTNGSWFPWTNNRNYIRGNTYLSGTLYDESNILFYIRPSATSVMSQVSISWSITGPTPTLSWHLATKAYVDSSIATRMGSSTGKWIYVTFWQPDMLGSPLVCPAWWVAVWEGPVYDPSYGKTVVCAIRDSGLIYENFLTTYWVSWSGLTCPAWWTVVWPWPFINRTTAICSISETTGPTSYTWPLTPTTYTVTFDGNGGAGHNPGNKTVNANTALGALPTNPTRSGYTFNGWWTATSGGSQIATTTNITTNVRYYAQWTYNCASQSITPYVGFNSVTLPYTNGGSSTPGLTSTSTSNANYICNFTYSCNINNGNFAGPNPNGWTCGCINGTVWDGTANTCVPATTYYWASGLYWSCSATCGTGSQTRSVVCKDNNGNTVTDINCASAGTKPVTSQSCNTLACECGSTGNTCTTGSPSGNVAGSCGGNQTWTCGGGGTANVSCTKANAACAPTAVNGSCSTTSNTCTTWSPVNYLAWSCGGNQTWTCNGSNGGTNSSCTMANAACAPTAVNGSCSTTSNTCTTWSPVNYLAWSCGGNQTWTCNGLNWGSNTACTKANAACLTYAWSQGGWGSCGNSCGSGTQYQSVSCLRSDGTVVGDGYCSGAKPATSQSCNGTNWCITLCSDPWWCAGRVGVWKELDGAGTYYRNSYDPGSCDGDGNCSASSCTPQTYTYTVPNITASKACEMYGYTYVRHTTQTHGTNCWWNYGLGYYNTTVNTYTTVELPLCWDYNSTCTSAFRADVNVISSITCK